MPLIKLPIQKPRALAKPPSFPLPFLPHLCTWRPRSSPARPSALHSPLRVPIPVSPSSVCPHFAVPPALSPSPVSPSPVSREPRAPPSGAGPAADPPRCPPRAAPPGTAAGCSGPAGCAGAVPTSCLCFVFSVCQEKGSTRIQGAGGVFRHRSALETARFGLCTPLPMEN